MPDLVPNTLLYHYTSQKGLMGIIQSKKIWATEIYYLNDAAEVIGAADRTIKILNTASLIQKATMW